MASGDPASTSPSRARRGLQPSTLPGLRSVARWQLWALPRRVLVFVLTVDAVAVVLGLATLLDRPLRTDDLTLLAILTLGTVVHLECVRHVERVRHGETSHGRTPYVDAKSMWSFAGLILMAPGPALVLVVFSLVWWWIRVSRRPLPHRWVFSGATVVVASVAAAAVLAPLGDDALGRGVEQPRTVALLVVAALVRWTINHGLVVIVIGLASPTVPWRQRLGSLTDNLIGLGALGLGIALAVLVEASPWLVPVLLVPVLAMHHGVLLGHFARAARTDPKTGLATIGHWRDQATRELARVRRRGGGLGVLMLDLDEFKAVNDRLGHVVGDVVLRAAADAVRDEIRTEDAVGRFGGEEFVVLLVEVTPEQVLLAAERVRRRVAECDGVPGAEGEDVARLTISVGAAAYPSTADDLDGLVAAADEALLRAKRDGRNCVRIAEPTG